MGLVKGDEGNLSTFDGAALAITRTGATLADLSEEDVLNGALDGPFPDASSDLEVHRGLYRERGQGAVAHAHPPGTVPTDGGGPGRHGAYAFAATLAEAVEAVVAKARSDGVAEGVVG
jgi:ribulose-5-phosphate 4-epimerase/fuculose-1-phosphate aldolase